MSHLARISNELLFLDRYMKDGDTNTFQIPELHKARSVLHFIYQQFQLVLLFRSTQWFDGER